MGLLWVHCQNTDCRYFDARYKAKVEKEISDSFADAVDKLILLQGKVGGSED